MTSNENILTPKLLIINGRQYRTNPFVQKCINEENNINEMNNKYKICKNDEGITLEMNNISSYYFLIIHERYMNLIKEIMKKTNTSIIIPKASLESQHICK